MIKPTETWRVRGRLSDHNTDPLSLLQRWRGLDPATENEYDPLQLPNMAAAVSRLRTAERNHESILIFGDYDADGITGSVLLAQSLQRRRLNFHWLLPHRVRDGYGLHAHLLPKILDSGATLMIAVDNGTTAGPLLDELADQGVDTIVLDHHQPEGDLSSRAIIVNPHLQPESCQCTWLSGVGVAWKFLQALEDPGAEDALDLVALGTIADMVPLRGENRLLVRRGLELINRDQRPGLKALRGVSRLNGKFIRAEQVAWQLAPRINSAGRMAEADLAAELLMTSDPDAAWRLAQQLDKLNQERKQEQQEGMKQVATRFRAGEPVPPIITEVGDWHQGIIGLIAGRVTQEYSRPSLIFTRRTEDGRLKASGRSLNGIDLTRMISAHRHLLDDFGGHAEAAGLTVRKDNLEPFLQGLNQEIRRYEDRLTTGPEVFVDLELKPEQVTLKLHEQMQQLEPFGMSNPDPLFLLHQVVVNRVAVLSGGKHLKLQLRAGERRLEALWWQHGEKAAQLKYGQRLDLLAGLSTNTWQDETRIQLIIRDLQVSGEGHARILYGENDA